MLDEILMNCTIDSKILATLLLFWEQKESRKVKANNHCSWHLHLVLRWEQDNKSRQWKVSCLWLTMPWVLGLVLKARQFWDISPRRCICKNSLTKRNFRAGSWISEQKFTQRLVTKGKDQTSYIDRKTGECFQLKTIGVGSNGDICNFLHTGRRETIWWEVGDANKSRLEQVSSSLPKVKKQTDVKNSCD